MTAEEFLNLKIEEGVISTYNKKHIIPIMEEYASLKVKEAINDKTDEDVEQN